MTRAKGLWAVGLGGLLLALAFFSPSALAQTNHSPQGSDRPTLIIYGHGIDSNGKRLTANLVAMFRGSDQPFQMARVSFTNAGIAGDHGKAVPFANRGAVGDLAREMAERVASKRHVMLNVDMSVSGIPVLAEKGFLGFFTPAVQIPLDATGAVTGARAPQLLDRLHTEWSSQTQAAATYIEAAAREFKRRHPHGVVILVGHSAFADAINQVPTREGRRQIIDLRVMASTMVRKLRHHDPAHTVFVTVRGDLPSAHEGDIYSPRNYGDLRSEGLVLQLRDNPFYNDNPVSRHSETQDFEFQVRDIEVESKGGTQRVRARPGDLIRNVILPQAESQTGISGRGTLSILRAEAPKQSRVGGISLTKAASVPVDPSDVRALEFDRSSGNGRLFLDMKSGGKLYIQTGPSDWDATAIDCIYRGESIEVGRGLTFRDTSHRLWVPLQVPNNQPCRDLSDTDLQYFLAKTDGEFATVAFGNNASYVPPYAAIEDYHPLLELEMDNDSWTSGWQEARYFVVPAVITFKRWGRDWGSLGRWAVQMAVRFEFWYESDTASYLAGEISGSPDPAGDYLGAQLTQNYDRLSKLDPRLKDLARLKKVAATVGIILWARQHGIPLDPDSISAVQAGTESDRERARGDPYVEFKRPDGTTFLAVPSPAPRKTPSLSQIERPAPIFNEVGLHRVLWKDGSQSEIDDDPVSGRVSSLDSRDGNFFSVLYDAKKRFSGIEDMKNRGIAVLWRASGPVLLTDVTFGWSGIPSDVPEDLQLHSDTRAVFGESATAILQSRIIAWLAAERNHDFSEAWLLGPRPGGSGSRIWIAALVVAFLLVAWRLFFRAVRRAPVAVAPGAGASGPEPTTLPFGPRGLKTELRPNRKSRETANADCATPPVRTPTDYNSATGDQIWQGDGYGCSGTATVAATAIRFVARGRFVVNTDKNALVKISHLGEGLTDVQGKLVPNFREWFLGKIEQPFGGSTLRYRTLRQYTSADGLIVAALGGEAKAETTLTEVFALMRLTEENQYIPGPLSASGWNIFYVKDVSGVLRSVHMLLLDGGWSISASSITGGDGWSFGSRVFSRKS